MKKYLVAALSALLLFIFTGLSGVTGVAHGHKTIEVKNGATIKGTVMFKGSIPAGEAIAITMNEDICGKEKKINKYIINDSKVKNVVVFIDNPQEGKQIPADTVIDYTIKDCNLEPRVNIGFVGGKFLFKNDDEILHTLQLKLWLEYQRKASGRPLKDGATIYNFALPHKGKQIEKPIKSSHRYQPDTGFINVTSNSHPWMRGYVFVFDHPYAAVTDEKGSFIIDNLPAGEYVLKTWHEGLGWQEKKINLSQNEVANIELVYEK